MREVRRKRNMENDEGRVCAITEPRILKSRFSGSGREVLCECCVSVPRFPGPFQSIFVKAAVFRLTFRFFQMREP